MSDPLQGVTDEIVDYAKKRISYEESNSGIVDFSRGDFSLNLLLHYVKGIEPHLARNIIDDMASKLAFTLLLIQKDLLYAGVLKDNEDEEFAEVEIPIGPTRLSDILMDAESFEKEVSALKKLENAGLKSKLPADFGVVEIDEDAEGELPIEPSMLISIREVIKNFENELLALKNLRNAAKKLNLRDDFFIKQKDYSWFHADEKSGTIAKTRPQNSNFGPYRPAIVDHGFSEDDSIKQFQFNKLWRLVEISCLQDQVDFENRGYGGGSTKSETRRAIRTFESEMYIDMEFLNSSGGLSNPWLLIANLLSLVDCNVDSSAVQRVIEKKKY